MPGLVSGIKPVTRRSLWLLLYEYEARHDKKLQFKGDI